MKSKFMQKLDEAMERSRKAEQQEEPITESFQNKEAFQWLMIVLQRDKIHTETFISDNPHIGLQLPSEKDSLNYKWTQWAKQKIENLK